jgi:hypothetical protein
MSGLRTKTNFESDVMRVTLQSTWGLNERYQSKE